MTKLAATIESVDALAYARELIRRLAAAGDGGSLFEPMASRTFVRNFMHSGALFSTKTRMSIIHLARAGDDDADAVIRDLILEIRGRGESLPFDLDNYAMELVHGDMRPRWSGPKKKNEFLRNIFIALMVAAICDRFGLTPTGRSARRRSGCAVVGQALEVIGRRMSAKAVEAIWRTYGRSMPTARGWVAAMGPLP
jgi:hypothetical protein